VRLRIRTVVTLAVAVAPVLTLVSGCYMRKPPHLKTDSFSGKPKGSALVKVLVTLQDDADKNCVIDEKKGVDPPRVLVFPGSAIRWRVVNNCTAPKERFLKFTQPQPREKVGDYVAKPWDYRFCTATIATLASGKDEKNVLLCEVPENVEPGIYKYSLEGAAKQDPEIEVRKGG
jgi:hypothetical protein